MTTFIDLKKAAARELNLLTSSDAIQTGKDVTETDLGVWINEGWKEETYPRLQSSFPHYFEAEAYAPNYSISGTISASSTGTTLVADDAIFTSSMVGQTVYNSTDNESAVIESFTSTTTVELDTTIGNTWDGDTIKIIDKDITFLGDAIDIYAIRHVGVRYTSTDTTYSPALRKEYNDLYQNGWETYTGGSPYYYLTTKSVTIDGVKIKYDAMVIKPDWTTPFQRAVYLRYGEIPASMVEDTDYPKLPEAHRTFLKWIAVRNAAVKRGDTALWQMANAEFEKGLTRLEKFLRLTTMDRSVKIKVPRRLLYMSRRNY